MDRVFDQISESHVFSASATVSKDLPRDRVITEILLHGKMVYDTGTAVTEAEDALIRMMGGLQIVGSRGQTFADIADLRLLYYLAHQLKAGALRTDAFDDTTSQSDVTKYVAIPLHFGVNWADRFDPSAGIPAEFGMSELKAKMVYPANSVGGTGVTTDATTAVYMAVAGLQGGAQQHVRMKPKITQSDYSPGATYSNLGYKANLPTGAFLRYSLIMNLDSSGNRNDTYITEIALEVPKLQAAKPFKLDWQVAKSAFGRAPVQGGNTPTSGGGIFPAGIILIDWKDLIDPSKAGMIDPRAFTYGFDLRNVEDGDLRLAFTVGTSGGTIKILHVQYEPM